MTKKPTPKRRKRKGTWPLGGVKMPDYGDIERPAMAKPTEYTTPPAPAMTTSSSGK